MQGISGCVPCGVTDVRLVWVLGGEGPPRPPSTFFFVRGTGARAGCGGGSPPSDGVWSVWVLWCQTPSRGCLSSCRPSRPMCTSRPGATVTRAGHTMAPRGLPPGDPRKALPQRDDLDARCMPLCGHAGYGHVAMGMCPRWACVLRALPRWACVQRGHP